jgi:hypothetical protein
MSKIISLLLISILLSACGAAPESTPAPEQLGTPTQLADASCSPPSSWTIEYHRTGGIAGFDQMLTLHSDGSLIVQSEQPAVDKQIMIPEDHVEPIRNLLVQACPFETGRADGVCADCYNYELNVEMDGRTYTVQATDTTLTEDLHPLISTLDEFLQLAGQ